MAFRKVQQKRPTIRANVPPISSLREANNDPFDQLMGQRRSINLFLSSESESSKSTSQLELSPNVTTNTPKVLRVFPKTTNKPSTKKISAGRVYKRSKGLSSKLKNYVLEPTKYEASFSFEPVVQSTPLVMPSGRHKNTLTNHSSASPVCRQYRAGSSTDTLISKFCGLNVADESSSPAANSRLCRNSSVDDSCSPGKFKGFKSPAGAPFDWDITMCTECNGVVFKASRDICNCPKEAGNAYITCSGNKIESSITGDDSAASVIEKYPSLKPVIQHSPKHSPLPEHITVRSRRRHTPLPINSVPGTPKGSLSSYDGHNSCSISSIPLSKKEDEEEDDTDDEDNYKNGPRDEIVLLERPSALVPQIPSFNPFDPRSLDPLDEHVEDQCEETDHDNSCSTSKSSPKKSPVDGNETPTNRTPTMRRKAARNSEERSPTGRSSGLGRASIIPDLIMVDEEPELNNDTDAIQPLQNIYLKPGKMYRRSLAIVKSFDSAEPSVHPLTEKGRQYEKTVDEVLKLQKDTKLSGAGNGDEDTSLLLRQSISFRRRQTMSLLLSRRRTSAGTPRMSELRQERSIMYRRMSAAIQAHKDSSKLSIQNVTSPLRPLNSSQEFVRTSLRLSGDASFGEQTTYYEDDGSKCTAETLVLEHCGQTRPSSFEDILSDECYVNGRKLGEGVYGEVFLITRNSNQTVLKLIPIEGDFLVNDAQQKTYEEVISEIFIAKALDGLRHGTIDNHYRTEGFVEIINIEVVQGRYPEKLLEFWNEHNREKGSLNDHPKLFDDNQLFIVMEQGFGGVALEDYSFTTARSALSIFIQITFALAIAECELEFEHRDLHWGNILVSRTSEKKIHCRLKGVDYYIPTHGVKGTIIDYTLSRMSHDKRITLFNDIGKDPDMFIGTGDYQFEVYRLMKKDVGNEWMKFVPKTNARWTFYILDKMLTKAKFQRKKANVHLRSIAKLEKIRSWIEECESALDIAQELMNELNF